VLIQYDTGVSDRFCVQYIQLASPVENAALNTIAIIPNRADSHCCCQQVNSPAER
jgi:hypothetical protein